MKVQVDVYANYKKIGKIWTDGKVVFSEPATNRILKYVVGRPVADYHYHPITAQDNPVQFVKLLWTNYKSQGIAASESYEISQSEDRPVDKVKKQKSIK